MAALRGEASPPTDDAASRTTLRDQVRDLAEHLAHVASLALVTSLPSGEAPEVGADHLLDGLAELAPRLDALRRTRSLLR